LYNIPDRPVFNLLGGVLLWTGVALCLYRWRDPRYFFLLSWLAIGLSPAFISTPPASLGHTILAQPVAYVLPALALTEFRRILDAPFAGGRFVPPSLGSWALILLFVATNGARDLQDYFHTWPRKPMVRVLYRADYREIAEDLSVRPGVEDTAVTSTLLGPWDRLALNVDTDRERVDVRLFDPGRALVWTADQGPSSVVLTPWPPVGSTVKQILTSHTVVSETLPSGLRRHQLSPPALPDLALGVSCSLDAVADGSSRTRHRFDNGLELTGACWLDEPSASVDEDAVLVTTWVLAEPLDLPPVPVVPNPPPPKTYSGPRLSVFAHVRDSAEADRFVAGDDGLWVDPVTLKPGDRFVQIHRFGLDRTRPLSSYTVELGLYDPMTGERRALLNDAGSGTTDRVILHSRQS
jgi:hypothetical protein